MRGGRLFEVTEIATTGDKMLMEEVLSNTGWTSADAEQILLLRIRRQLRISLHRCPSAPSPCPSCPSCRCLSSRRISVTLPAWRSSRWRTGGSCHRSAFANFTARLGLMCVSAGLWCAGVCNEKGACVCVRGRRWRCSRISACFWRLCGYLHGAASCWAGKRGLEEHETVAVELKNCILFSRTASSPV